MIKQDRFHIMNMSGYRVYTGVSMLTFPACSGPGLPAQGGLPFTAPVYLAPERQTPAHRGTGTFAGVRSLPIIIIW
jgi:hypothetical protein